MKKEKTSDEQALQILDDFAAGKKLKPFKPEVNNEHNIKAHKEYWQSRESVDQAVDRVPKTETEINE